MHIDINQKYWLTIEPYVYVNFSSSSVLLYNTLDGKYVESDNILVVQLVKNIAKKENCGVYLLTNKELKNECIKSFIIKIRQNFIGDILPTSLSEGKPIQFMSFLNFQQDRNRLSEQPNISIGENVLDYLHEVNLNFDEDDELSIDKLNDVIEQLYQVSVINLCNNLFGYSHLNSLLKMLSKINGKKNIIYNYNNLQGDYSLLNNLGKEYSFVVNVDFPLNTHNWEALISLKISLKRDISLVFCIEKEEDLEQVELLVSNYSINNYKLKPVYNNKNIDFFRTNIFLTKDDILSSNLSMKEIFANKTLNTYNFGKLEIKSNGDVFAKGNEIPTGNIKENTIKEIIYNEIKKGNSWLNLRNKKPCNNCLYQWICPSPSNYEKEIGKPNLCHVHPL